MVRLLIRREREGWMVALLVGRERDGRMLALLVGESGTAGCCAPRWERAGQLDGGWRCWLGGRSTIGWLRCWLGESETAGWWRCSLGESGTAGRLRCWLGGEALLDGCAAGWERAGRLDVALLVGRERYGWMVELLVAKKDGRMLHSSLRRRRTAGCWRCGERRLDAGAAGWERGRRTAGW